jgi:(S)-2-hydroxy-acid oxidase
MDWVTPSNAREYWTLMQVIRLRENEKAYDRIKIRPRILADVSNIDTSTEFLGSKVLPIRLEAG